MICSPLDILKRYELFENNISEIMNDSHVKLDKIIPIYWLNDSSTWCCLSVDPSFLFIVPYWVIWHLPLIFLTATTYVSIFKIIPATVDTAQFLDVFDSFSRNHDKCKAAFTIKWSRCHQSNNFSDLTAFAT